MCIQRYQQFFRQLLLHGVGDICISKCFSFFSVLRYRRYTFLRRPHVVLKRPKVIFFYTLYDQFRKRSFFRSSGISFNHRCCVVSHQMCNQFFPNCFPYVPSVVWSSFTRLVGPENLRRFFLAHYSPLSVLVRIKGLRSKSNGQRPSILIIAEITIVLF